MTRYLSLSFLPLSEKESKRERLRVRGDREGEREMHQAELSRVVSGDAPGACVAQKENRAPADAPPSWVALKLSPVNGYRCKDSLRTTKKPL